MLLFQVTHDLLLANRKFNWNDFCNFLSILMTVFLLGELLNAVMELEP